MAAVQARERGGGSIAGADRKGIGVIRGARTTAESGGGLEIGFG
jgi:hypothetical protein